MSQLRADAVAACALGRERFAAARLATSVHMFDARFAGLRVRVELVGDAVHDVLAGAFLRDDGASMVAPLAPDLTLQIWDGASTGVDWPAPEPTRREPIVVGQHFAVAGTSLVFWEPPWIYGLDLEARVATFFTPDVAELKPWARSQPCLRLLHAWCRASSRLIVHGAVIGRGDRGALLVGRGGSGKSTLAIAGALAGWSYLGDDYVALDASARPPLAHALYGIAKLAPDHLQRRLPDAAALRIPTSLDDGKVLLDLAPRTLRRGLELVSVIVPEVTGGPPVLRPIGPGRAMLALAPRSWSSTTARPIAARPSPTPTPRSASSTRTTPAPARPATAASPRRAARCSASTTPTTRGCRASSRPSAPSSTPTPRSTSPCAPSRTSPTTASRWPAGPRAARDPTPCPASSSRRCSPAAAPSSAPAISTCRCAGPRTPTGSCARTTSASPICAPMTSSCGASSTIATCRRRSPRASACWCAPSAPR